MANKKVVIEFDLDNSKLKIANEETLSLTQKIRLLKSELQKTKEGTKEFEILSKQLNNTKDDLARVSTKNRELLSTFSLIPGPIGDIFGKLNGVIGLLKTFSGFSLKDIGNQFKGFFGDIKNITDSFYGLNKNQKINTELVDEGTLATDAATAANLKDNELRKGKSEVLNESTVATDAATAAQLKQNEVTVEGSNKLSEYQSELMLARRGIDVVRDANIELASGFDTTTDIIQDANGTYMIWDDTLKEQVSTLNAEEFAALEASQSVEHLGEIVDKAGTTTKKATVQYGIMGTALQTLGFEAAAASAAVVVLDTVLAAIGIGIIIAAVVALISVITDLTSQFYGWASGADAAKKAMDEVNKTVEKTNELLDLDLKGSKRRNEEYIALLKSRGATEKEVNKATMDGLKERLTLTETALDDISKAENKALKEGKVTTEEYKKIETERTKLEQQTKDLRSQIRVKELDGITDNNKKVLEEEKKGIEESKKLRDKQIEDNNTADEALLTLLNENAALRQRDKRKREDEELKTAMEAEERAINALKISEEKKGILLNQIKIKYGYKVLDINDKRVEEDQKAMDDEAQKLREFNQKKQTILDEASANEIEKEKNTRKTTYENDLAELERDINFIKLSEDEKGKLRIALRTALNNDLKKIDDDAKEKEKQDKLKKIDDDIKFQEISNEANKNNFQEYFNGRQKLLELSKERELSEVEAGSEKALLIEKKYATLSKDLQKEKFQAVLGFIGQGLSAASNAISQAQQVNALAMQNELDEVKGNAEKEDKIKEKYFEKNKNTQIAQAIISTLQSAISAYSSLAVIPVVGPVLGGIAAAAALVFGYKQVALIKAQKYQSSSSGAASGAKPGKNYGDGGMIEGPRHSSGGVPITAEGGEAVMTRGSVTMFRPLLSMMNQMGGGTSFSKGAVGQSSFDNPKSTVTEPQIIKTYVVENELTSNQHRIARLKDLSTL